MKNKYPVVELFDSIDGEGKRTGLMAIFVRFAGCNLRCNYCDTAYALKKSDALEVLTADELLERIQRYPWKRITFTGGEPMLQDLLPLCEVLSDEGYDINIETNGAVPLFPQRPAHVFYTMDYKCTDSGMKEHMLLSNFEELDERDVLKFVVSSRRDLDDMRRIVTSWTGKEPAFYVSPVWGRITPAELVEYVRENKLSSVCVQVQLHKIIWGAERRGV